jgi:diguanylate cyclase (GGDEF)-like protein
LKRAKVTVSIGVAAPDKNLTDPERVLKAADRALYTAKKAGRNRVKS